MSMSEEAVVTNNNYKRLHLDQVKRIISKRTKPELEKFQIQKRRHESIINSKGSIPFMVNKYTSYISAKEIDYIKTQKQKTSFFMYFPEIFQPVKAFLIGEINAKTNEDIEKYKAKTLNILPSKSLLSNEDSLKLCHLLKRKDVDYSQKRRNLKRLLQDYDENFNMYYKIDDEYYNDDYNIQIQDNKNEEKDRSISNINQNSHIETISSINSMIKSSRSKAKMINSDMSLFHKLRNQSDAIKKYSQDYFTFKNITSNTNQTFNKNIFFNSYISSKKIQKEEMIFKINKKEVIDSNRFNYNANNISISRTKSMSKSKSYIFNISTYLNEYNTKYNIDEIVNLVKTYKKKPIIKEIYKKIEKTSGNEDKTRNINELIKKNIQNNNNRHIIHIKDKDFLYKRRKILNKMTG